MAQVRKLPDSLCRKAIMEIFDKLVPITWEKLFEREDTNGLGKLRTNGDYSSKAYYRTGGVMEWLVRNGHYTLDEYRRAPKLGGRDDSRAPVGLSFRSLVTRAGDQRP